MTRYRSAGDKITWLVVKSYYYRHNLNGNKKSTVSLHTNSVYKLMYVSVNLGFSYDLYENESYFSIPFTPADYVISFFMLEC